MPVAEIPEAIREATAEQPAARVALAAAAAAPTHAYLFAGPPGSGKRAAARALAAELLAEGSNDPAEARRRAVADPSPHPDLAWLRPPGAQHLVDEVRERVIAAAAYRPFEGARRVFVIEAAEAMAEESQNALLKTLEEPSEFAHLILITAEPEALLETVRSRCVPIRFGRLSAEAVAARLAAEPAPDLEREAAARLSDGDAERARFLLSENGRAVRAAAESLVRAALEGDLSELPWSALTDAAEAAGEHAAERVRVRAEEVESEAAERSGPAARRRARDTAEELRRSSRAARAATLDLGLALVADWLRDLVAAAEGAPQLILTADRAGEIEALAEGLDPRRARRAAELVMDTRRRLSVNVNEALAAEALAFRLEFLLASRQ